MVISNHHGLHHFQKRHKKQIQNKKLKSFIDKFIYFIVFIGPVMTIPQIYNIWIIKNASGVSIISWSAYLFQAFFWLIYALVHKDKPIFLSSIIWIFLETIIVIGTAIYG